MAGTTRQSPSAIPMKPYGSFAGKTEESAPTGRIMSSMAGHGGLSGAGGLAGKGGGLAG